jgi:hypothetical protein
VSAQELVGEGQIAGTKVAVREIKRDEGGTVTLRFQLINETDKALRANDVFKEFVLNNVVHLIDAAHKKKYLVVKDTSGNCVCAASGRQQITKNGPLNLWAKFGAPPETVQKVTVVVTGFEPVESVPITAR